MKSLFFTSIIFLAGRNRVSSSQVGIVFEFNMFLLCRMIIRSIIRICIIIIVVCCVVVVTPLQE